MLTIHVAISLLVGTILTSLFIIVVLRPHESWWLSHSELDRPLAIYIFSLAPIGIFFLCLAIATYYQFRENLSSQIWNGAFLAVLLLSIVVLIAPPKQIKPGWLQWLEQEYGYCLNTISDLGRAMPGTRWQKLVKSQADLQKWLNEQYEFSPKPMDKAWELERRRRLSKRAQQDGSDNLRMKEPLPGYIPAHRRQEEAERIKWEISRPKKKTKNALGNRKPGDYDWEERASYTKHVSVHCPNRNCKQGVAPCTQCKGSGRLKNGICPRCSGGGVLICDECKTCYYCGGKGYRMYKIARKQCTVCYGAGRINRAIDEPSSGTLLWFGLPMAYLLLWALYFFT